MRTEHYKVMSIHHPLADIRVEPHTLINTVMLKQLICLALDCYKAGDYVSAETVHQETKKRHGEKYQTVGYYLKIYRSRKSLTQKELAELTGLRQHHLSEMEHNKRPIGKGMAKKIAAILNIDYRKLL